MTKKRFIAILCLSAGIAIAVVRLSGLFWSFTIPSRMTSGLSGLLIFLGLVVYGLDRKARSEPMKQPRV